MIRQAVKAVLRAAVKRLPAPILRLIAAETWATRPDQVVEAIVPALSRASNLDTMPLDLPADGEVRFEHLAGLFTSNAFTYGVVSMPIRQAAYIFGLIRQLPARTVIEIGRYKGGTTVLMAAAMPPGGQLWSIDIGEKERRLSRDRRAYDEQCADMLRHLRLQATLLVGDSRTIAVDTGAVDVVLIDGDHSYEGARNDFERFGRRVRVGGAVLFDDAVADGAFASHADTVGRVVQEAVQGGAFRLVKTVNHLAHLERVRPDAGWS